MENSYNNLYDKLRDYSETDVYPFHMPGHKRNIDTVGVSLPFNIDITEIDGFDNLHSPEGILKAAADKARKVFHSDHSYMLINGSTCGILAAIHAATHIGDEIILARNCHKAVYNGCQLRSLRMNFIFPEQDSLSGVSGSITPESVLSAIEACPEARAVVITSPTYEGVISDIGTIAEITHRYKIPLIVDNAHGAHQAFCKFCDGEPIANGADIVISSLHKTLPSLTQTAVAHVNGNLISPKRFEYALSIFETSSPSYILMSSIDNCFDFLMKGTEKFSEYEKNLRKFSESMKLLKNLTVLCHGNDELGNHKFYSFDYGKIVICTVGTSISGVGLMKLLREKYHLELEMTYPFYAVAMTSVCDTAEGFERLTKALIEIDGTLTRSGSKIPILPIPKPVSSEIDTAEAAELSDEEAARNEISNRFIYAYPPGIPIIIPGEKVDDSVVEYIEKLRMFGITVY